MAPEGGYRTPDGQGRSDERQRQISEIPSTSGLNGALMRAMPHRSIVTTEGYLRLNLQHRAIVDAAEKALR